VWISKLLESDTGPEHDFVNTELSQQVALFYVHFCQYPINYMAHLQYIRKFPNSIFLSDNICVLFRDILFNAFLLQLQASKS